MGPALGMLLGATRPQWGNSVEASERKLPIKITQAVPGIFAALEALRGCLKSPGRSRLTVRGPGFAPAVWKLEWGNIVGEI